MHCSECLRLDKKYEATILAIYEVVNCRFANPWEKIRQLRIRQEARDAAMHTLYKHTESHSIPPKAKASPVDRPRCRKIS